MNKARRLNYNSHTKHSNESVTWESLGDAGIKGKIRINIKFIAKTKTNIMTLNH